MFNKQGEQERIYASICGLSNVPYQTANQAVHLYHNSLKVHVHNQMKNALISL